MLDPYTTKRDALEQVRHWTILGVEAIAGFDFPRAFRMFAEANAWGEILTRALAHIAWIRKGKDYRRAALSVGAWLAGKRL